MAPFSCDWSQFQDFPHWMIDLWPILHLVLVLQEVQDLLSLLWSHCIHLGLENQYLHLDLGDPDTQAHVISLTSDPLLAGLINTFEWQPKKYLTGTPSMPGKPGTPTLPWNQKKSHIFPSDWWLVSQSLHLQLRSNQTEPEPNVFTTSPLCPAAPAGPSSPFWPFSPQGPWGPGKPGGPCGPCHPKEPGGPFS